MCNENNIPEIYEEDIKEFPEQTTFNTDDMSIVENNETGEQ